MAPISRDSIHATEAARTATSTWHKSLAQSRVAM